MSRQTYKDERRTNAANKYRKNLLAAWNWGSDFFEGFPQVAPPFLKVKPFPARHGEGYALPGNDVIKVFQQAEGQDLVMLLPLYFTGGRRSEIFRLTWNDVDLQKEKIRLTDNKSGNGMERERWLRMHPELVKALKWWRDDRPARWTMCSCSFRTTRFWGNRSPSAFTSWSVSAGRPM